MSPAKRLDLARLGTRWGLRDAIAPGAPLEAHALDRAFGRRAPRLLDIGVGNGSATVAWARYHPEADVLAIELHQPGLVQLLRDLDAGAAPNVRVLEVDVTEIITTLEPHVIDHVRVLFPDPWPKRRHHYRRLIDPWFVGRVADLLPAGGTLHVATDHEDYAEHTRAVLAAEVRFEPRPESPELNTDWRSTRPERPVTAYEQRGLTSGRRITDLVVHRR